ncbi:Integral membrane protein similar to MviN (frequently involved in viability and virulence) [Paracholeplasma brassicae]|uniref:Probable lipid II flippase MurJ n=1 Tax=Acholeplasma brassicae TaxID=61635 RepID=U4KQT9_9MOLU|nr:murein biosynthesis integral membrane protein MurJ [Paracholeplasma brassicae]CCV65143.1 Integral membrane protein similar to MviN (frequently involved in viability and virulence) [Paracholeplasma brassicae]
MKPKPKQFLSSLVKTVSLLTLITISSKMLGLLREVGIASYFGVGLTSDAFYAALIIPALLFTSVGVAIQNLFMIEFTAVKNQFEDIDHQSRLSSNVSNILVIIAIIIASFSFILTPYIVKVIAPGFTDPDKFNLTVKLTRILIPTMVIIPVYQIRASMLRVYERFVTVALIDLCFNLFQISYLFIFADRFGIEGLAYSILFAYLTQWLTIEIIAHKMGFKIKKILDFKDPHWVIIFRLFIPTMISFGIIQVNSMVDKIIASNLGDGAISALNYGFMIRNLIYTVVISTILMVVYPILLKSKEANQMDSYHEVGNKTLEILWVLTLPLTTLLMIFSKPVVSILFERGEFTDMATKITSDVLFYYAIGIAFFAVKEFLVIVSYTHKNRRLPLFITLIGALLNIGFSLVLKQSMGVNGIAFGLAISEIISVVIMVIYIYKNQYLQVQSSFRELMVIFLINVVLAYGLYSIYPRLGLSSHKLIELSLLILYGTIFMTVYALMLHLFKIRLFRDFFKQIRRKSDV